MNTYIKGDLVRASAEFRDAGGSLADPTAVAFKFKVPAGTTTTYNYGTDAQLVKDAVGEYHADIDASTSGTWSYRFESTGAGQAAAEDQFTVSAGNF